MTEDSEPVEKTEYSLEPELLAVTDRWELYRGTLEETGKPYDFVRPRSIDDKDGYIQDKKDIKARADIPQSFYDKKIEDFKWDIYKKPDGEVIDLSYQKKYVDSFIDNFQEWEKQGLGLYIWSSMRGTGKTFLASCICNELISRYPMGTKFVSANKLIDIAKSGDKDSKDSKDIYLQDPIELLCNCKLLVIDDLGQKKSGADWMGDILFRIFDSRLQSKSVTIVTSNIKLEALDMDDRIVDRLYKMCQSIPLPEYSIRQREANEDRVEFLRRMGLTRKERT